MRCTGGDDCRCPECYPFASDAHHIRWLEDRARSRDPAAVPVPAERRTVLRGPTGLLPGDEEIMAARAASTAAS